MRATASRRFVLGHDVVPVKHGSGAVTRHPHHHRLWNAEPARTRDEAAAQVVEPESIQPSLLAGAAEGLSDLLPRFACLRIPMFHGFIRRGSAYTTLDYPMGRGTRPSRGIRTTLVWLGGYFDTRLTVAWSNDGGTWTRIDYAGAHGTFASAIDSRGRILGTWLNKDGVEHGFLFERGAFADLTVPTARAPFSTPSSTTGPPPVSIPRRRAANAADSCATRRGA